MTEDPILEALFCTFHGRIWERRKSGGKALPLFYVGIDGFCESCVVDFLQANIKSLKRVNYKLEDDNGDKQSTREGVSRDDA